MAVWVLVIQSAHVALQLVLERLFAQFAFVQILAAFVTAAVELAHHLNCKVNLVFFALRVFFEHFANKWVWLQTRIFAVFGVLDQSLGLVEFEALALVEQVKRRELVALVAATHVCVAVQRFFTFDQIFEFFVCEQTSGVAFELVTWRV